MAERSPSVLSGSVDRDLELFRAAFDRCADVIFRTFEPAGGGRGAVVFIDGMIDEERLEAAILRPLTEHPPPELRSPANAPPERRIPVDRLAAETSPDAVAAAVCRGDAAVLLDGHPAVYLAALTKLDKRAVEEPATEPVIRGPRDGFTENLRVNVTLVRRRLVTTDLKIETMQIGRLSQTALALVYLDSLVLPGVLEEVKKRLERIDIDAVLESGYIEELITDNPRSLFPLMLNTERPDRVTGGLLEGRAAILIDNTPFALVVPGTFADTLHASEDYYQHYMVASVTRLLRLWLSLSALVFPSIYIAVTTFHQEMIPTSLLLGIASSREAVPFPAIVEAILMEAAFEGLREAGIRLPRPVGQAVSIVGALVIGQAAVQAGIVSSLLVIVVSFTGIASFIFPVYSQGQAVRLLRFPMMLLAGMLGLYGLFLGLLVVLIHLAKLRSFGVPYLSPLAPLQPSGLKDVFVRVPWWRMRRRPGMPQRPKARKRMKAGLRPGPDQGK